VYRREGVTTAGEVSRIEGVASLIRIDSRNERQCNWAKMILISRCARAASLFCCVFLLPVYLSAQQSSAQQSNQISPQSGDHPIAVTTNAVVVPVVVRDSHGHTVDNLKMEDFQVLDKNTPQVISQFSIERREEAQTSDAAHDAAAANPAASQAPAPTTNPPPAVPDRFVVYLFDDLHVSAGDLMRLKQATAKMIGESLGESDVAAVVSMSGTSSGMTRDPAKLQAAIMKLQPNNVYRSVRRECPDIGYYEADRIMNKFDSMATDTAVRNTMACSDDDQKTALILVQDAAREALQVGDADVLNSFGFIKEIVRKMSAMPGQRVLILVSPGFLTVTTEAVAEESDVVDLAARSDVTINTVDVRGLYTTNLDAGERSKVSVEANLTESQYVADSMGLNEEVMVGFADGTGGTFFHNSNDLAGGLRAVTAAPECVYQLVLSLQNVKEDGKYHELSVKVDKPGVTVVARHGYFAPKAAKSKTRK
jgi:VWFA-related protein